MQGTRDKAYYHLERAEFWQSRVSAMEDAAMVRAKMQLDGRMQRADGLETDPGYVADSILRDRNDYKAACGNRNSHQRQAEIYMMAYLCGIKRTPWARTAAGLVQVQVPTPAE
jgi:hypothetical protein